jgi:hypothetical protein
MFYRVHLAMSGFQTHLSGALIAQVVGNPTTMRLRPRQPHNCIWKAIHNLKDDYNFLYFKLEWDLKFKLYLHDIELFDTQMYICFQVKLKIFLVSVKKCSDVVPLLGNIKWQACVCHTSIADVNVKVNDILTLEFGKRQTDVFLFCVYSFCVFCLILPVSLDCPLLIVPSVFSSVYILSYSTQQIKHKL